MNIRVGVSNRHIHLTSDDYKLLFKDELLEKRNDLSQKGEFASTKTVIVEGPKGRIENVRVLGPFRDYTQVELTKTDGYKLGIDLKVSSSGELSNAENITIIGPFGSIVRKSAIIQNRHVHISYEEKELYGLASKVDIEIENEKNTIFKGVDLKLGENCSFELHLDTDDANSALVKSGDIVKIIK